MKASAKKWTELLREEYYDNGNAVGRNTLYLSLKRKRATTNDYPTKSFVRGWLQRQASNQVYRQHPRKSSSTQAIITSQPNELLQVDDMYFYRNITGEPITFDDDESDAQIAAVIVIGFSVDFTVHLAHMYIESESETRGHR